MSEQTSSKPSPPSPTMVTVKNEFGKYALLAFLQLVVLLAAVYIVVNPVVSKINSRASEQLVKQAEIEFKQGQLDGLIKSQNGAVERATSEAQGLQNLITSLSVTLKTMNAGDVAAVLKAVNENPIASELLSRATPVAHGRVAVPTAELKPNGAQFEALLTVTFPTELFIDTPQVIVAPVSISTEPNTPHLKFNVEAIDITKDRCTIHVTDWSNLPEARRGVGNMVVEWMAVK